MAVDDSSSLREQQLMFANYLRNPALFPAPLGVEERRLRVYRDLFINNMSQLLASTFPVIRSILSDLHWQELIRDFYTWHRSETPLFPYIAGEFAAYLLSERKPDSAYPFLAELAQYEWSEIALRHSDAELPDNTGKSKPALSPLCLAMVYAFPVHRIGGGFVPLHPTSDANYLLVYRNRADDVKFMESSAATFRLLQLLEDESLADVPAVCKQLAAEMQHPEPAILAAFVTDTVAQLLRADVLFQ